MRVEDHVDTMLDSALEMTFPASDPFTIYFPETRRDEVAAADEVRELEAAARAARVNLVLE